MTEWFSDYQIILFSLSNQSPSHSVGLCPEHYRQTSFHIQFRVFNMHTDLAEGQQTEGPYCVCLTWGTSL